ncbi:MAG: response regulator [Treponema sp.]|jgi:DNA-binding response OmpR family regulator|nr:response regulator [Treponema sp.]
MKKVLIIDSHQLFRDFLKQKLSVDQVEVVLTQENRDSYPKMLTVLPNLIILDMSEDRVEEMAFLEKKINDPNTANIPVIITGPTAEKSSIASLAKYGVIKYFAKPIQFDVFFEAIGHVLHNPLSMDTTPSVLDLHRNNSIIFIELAVGLNREKIALLQYKLTEMIETEEIESPKILIMLTNLELTFVDGFNLEFLLDNILACPKVHTKYVKILSLSPFLKEFLDGHEAYNGIEMSNNLPKVLNSLIDTTITSSVSDLITDRILTSSYLDEDSSSVETRFFSDTNSDPEALKQADGTVLNIAIIDSDLQSLAMSKQAFENFGANCSVFQNGKAFMDSYAPEKYNLIILDVILVDNMGLNILNALKNRYDAPPVIVYTQSLQRDWVVKILSSGAKSYLVKPLKPQVLVQKSLALLKGDF